MKDIKAFTVKFQYTVEETAFLAIAAPDAETAQAGAESLLAKFKSYQNPEIVSVTETQSEETPEVTVN